MAKRKVEVKDVVRIPKVKPDYQVIARLVVKNIIKNVRGKDGAVLLGQWIELNEEGHTMKLVRKILLAEHDFCLSTPHRGSNLYQVISKSEWTAFKGVRSGTAASIAQTVAKDDPSEVGRVVGSIVEGVQPKMQEGIKQLKAEGVLPLPTQRPKPPQLENHG